MMTLNKYNELLTTMPDSLSDEFIPWLKENNVVVDGNDRWVIVENCKYHTPEHPHYTAFFAGNGYITGEFHNDPDMYDMSELSRFIEDLGCQDWFKYENSTLNKTLKRYHIHLVRDQDHWVEMMYKLGLAKGEQETC